MLQHAQETPSMTPGKRQLRVPGRPGPAAGQRWHCREDVLAPRGRYLRYSHLTGRLADGQVQWPGRRAWAGPAVWQGTLCQLPYSGESSSRPSHIRNRCPLDATGPDRADSDVGGCTGMRRAYAQQEIETLASRHRTAMPQPASRPANHCARNAWSATRQSSEGVRWPRAGRCAGLAAGSGASGCIRPSRCPGGILTVVTRAAGLTGLQRHLVMKTVVPEVARTCAPRRRGAPPPRHQ